VEKLSLFFVLLGRAIVLPYTLPWWSRIIQKVRIEPGWNVIVTVSIAC